MKRAGFTVAFVLAGFAGAGAQPMTPQPVTPPPTPTPAPVPSAPVETARPLPRPGPVLIEGKSVFMVSFGAQKAVTVNASQTHAAAGSYFVATPGTICSGAVKVTAGTQVLTTNGSVTSDGPFNLTRVGSTTGCAITVSSSAGGRAATIVFQ